MPKDSLGTQIRKFKLFAVKDAHANCKAFLKKYPALYQEQHERGLYALKLFHIQSEEVGPLGWLAVQGIYPKK